MHLSTKTGCLLLFLLALSRPDIKAQSPLPDSLIRDSAFSVALQQYHEAVRPETNLYHGSQYSDYHHSINTGHPYFIDSVIAGNIWYNGLRYPHVPLIYDLVLGLVVIKDPYGNWNIGLNSLQVDSFTVGDHFFIRLRDSLNPTAPRNGFYEQLHRGRVLLLKRETKFIQNDPSYLENRIERYIEDVITFYVKKGDTYFPVNTKRSLALVLKERGRELNKFIRSNHLSFRKDKENTIVKVISWYDPTDK